MRNVKGVSWTRRQSSQNLILQNYVNIHKENENFQPDDVFIVLFRVTKKKFISEGLLTSS